MIVKNGDKIDIVIKGETIQSFDSVLDAKRYEKKTISRESCFDSFGKIEKISKNIQKNDGFLVLKDVVLSKSGVFGYGEKKEYQHPSSFDSKYLNTISKSPVVIEHPKDEKGHFFIGDKGFKGVNQVGHPMNVRMSINQDGEIVVKGDLSITDERAMLEIGGDDDYGVSLGYKKNIVNKKGKIGGQDYDRIAFVGKNDHIALTKAPRKENFIKSYDSVEGGIMSEKIKEMESKLEQVLNRNKEIESKLEQVLNRNKEIENENKDLKMSLDSKEKEENKEELHKEKLSVDSNIEKMENHAENKALQEKVSLLQEKMEHKDVVESLDSLGIDMSKSNDMSSQEIKKKFIIEDMGLDEAKSFDSIQVDMTYSKALSIKKKLLEKEISNGIGKSISGVESMDSKEEGYVSFFKEFGFNKENNILFVDPIMSGTHKVMEGKLIKKKEIRGNVSMFGSAYCYSDRDISHANSKGINLSQKYAEATREEANQMLNNIFLIGGDGIKDGLVNNLDVPNATVDFGLTPWGTLDTKQKEDVLTGIVNRVMINTNKLMANTLCLSTQFYTDIKTISKGTDNNGMTIYNSLLEKFSDIPGFMIKWIPEFTDLSVNGTSFPGNDVIMAYNRDSQNIEAQMVMPLEFSNIEQKTGGWDLFQYARMSTGGVWWKQPESGVKVNMARA